ncbi:hypothetical protein [Rhodococcus sp. 1139]|uniref:hypothetical protein n=1 Tax=Rhodococcus sp. 1139 TaxID=1833762 RepID=UPI00087310E1|nr:hypothetical protein [Rhodococcus sp. 1139]OFE08245.1 hypothetical protein A5N83_13835 [Rhodococcus sp. 1139]
MIPTPESGPSSPSIAAARDDEATARKVMSIVSACVEQLEALANDRVSVPLAEALHLQQLAIDISGVALDSMLRWPQ